MRNIKKSVKSLALFSLIAGSSLGCRPTSQANLKDNQSGQIDPREAATVGIEIKLGTYSEFATGVVIGHLDAGNAVVLTVYHAFRDAFAGAPNAPHLAEITTGLKDQPETTYKGLAFNFKEIPGIDAALIILDNSEELFSTPLASEGGAPSERGTTLYSTSRSPIPGESLKEAHIIKVDNTAQPPSNDPTKRYYTDFIPEKGRSGGPLFNAKNEVVGVASNNGGDVGLFTHLDSIYEVMKKLNVQYQVK